MPSPRPSSTVVVARDSGHGPELLLVRRRAGDAFGDSYTFPGGVLDADEAHAADYCTGRTAAEADALLGTESGGLAYFSAAVRELFEETGLLLGATGGVDDSLRARLNAGDIGWSALLDRLALTIPCERLEYFAHWITPSALPKRWSTRFFLAAASSEHEVRPDGVEILDYCWTTPREALDSATAGERKIPFPTRRTLEDLCGQPTVAALLEWAREQQALGIPAIQPEIRADDGKRRIFMPQIDD